MASKKFRVEVRDVGATEWTAAGKPDTKARAIVQAEDVTDGRDVRVIREGGEVVWTNAPVPTDDHRAALIAQELGEESPVGMTDEEAVLAGFLDPEDLVAVRDRPILMWTVTRTATLRKDDEMVGGTVRLPKELRRKDTIVVDRRGPDALRGTWFRTSAEKAAARKEATEVGPMVQHAVEQEDGTVEWQDVRSFANRSTAARRGRIDATCSHGAIRTRVVEQGTGKVLWTSDDDEGAQLAIRHGLRLTTTATGSACSTEDALRAHPHWTDFFEELDAREEQPVEDEDQDAELIDA